MAREDAIQVEGKVIEVLPNTTVRVELPNGHRILAYLSGRLRMAFIRLMPGDQVNIEMSPYDLSKGCIVGKRDGI
ncbi:MAG TPA: translation initiation factor IF-1 [Candidatus Paceibacterota bacterium]|nr:translation initiation factor IF-1 [Verrucomicrobiota bacterium]HRY47242.1 translation initiation factor IF-1 [Candidatus Paceibacterota bacterium]HSA02288.1 translation initiation factor IF-1 [Candidatus Paceibacterota bacterium]